LVDTVGQEYKEISHIEHLETGHVDSIYEKTINDFVLRLNSNKGEYAYAISLYISKNGKNIAFIRTAYFPDEKMLLIEDIDTHFGYRRKGLGRLRLREVISFLSSKGEKPQTVIVEGVGYLGTLDGEGFVKKLGFHPIENSLDWRVSFEELNKRLNP
jgi:GNAT superfamily N-acetyltransferase